MLNISRYQLCYIQTWHHFVWLCVTCILTCLQSEYSGLAEQLSEYVVRLLDKVHGNEELNAILNACDSHSGVDDGLVNTTLPRLQLAIKYKEKKVSLII